MYMVSCSQLSLLLHRKITESFGTYFPYFLYFYFFFNKQPIIFRTLFSLKHTHSAFRLNNICPKNY